MPLLTYVEAPRWTDPNPFILTGYRRGTQSWSRCVASWFYTHNESGNIWSHLLPGLVLALYLFLEVGLDLNRFYINLRSFDGAVVGLQLGSAILCLFLSAMYHTFLNHSPAVYLRWLQLDYVGILGIMLGNFVGGLHFGFYCAPALRNVYWSIVS